MKPRLWGVARGIVLLPVVCCLSAPPAGAEERFHLFPETEIAPPPALRVQLEGLPPAAPLVALRGVPARPASLRKTASPPVTLTPYRTERSFAAAALETLGLDVLPWLVNRYAVDSTFAHISVESTRNNIQTGFTYDHDPLPTNQSSHPYHGSLYFNAARTNGYSFWESAPFALGASFLWEMFSEQEPPALNDLVNTTLGGMAWGEAQFRISNMILDNTKSGLERFLREAAGLVVNPMGGFNRLIRGEMAKDFQNAPDRYPGRLYMEMDGGYLQRGGSAAADGESHQGTFSFLLRYGDPFEGNLRHPFDVFNLEVGLKEPAHTLLTQVVVTGLLNEWKLSESPSAEQRFALYLRADYLYNEPQVYAGQAFGAGHLMRIPLAEEIDLRTEVSVEAMPLAALGVDYDDEGLYGGTGRTYDYGPGLGARVSAKVRRHQTDLLVLAWSLLGQSTSNGISKNSRVQTLSAEARVPVTRSLLLGAAWSWGERLTTYSQLPTTHPTGTSWQLFAGWAIPQTREVPVQETEPSAGPADGPGATGRFDVSAFAGGFFGSRVYTGEDQKVLMTNAPVYGLRAGYGLTRVFSLEASWSHAAPELQPKDPVTGASAGEATPATVNSYELDGLFGFGGEKVRGYVGLGAGVQNVQPPIASLDASGATTRFAANIALGGLYFFTPHAALRVDGRYRWRAGDERVGTVGCEPAPIGCKPYTTDLFSTGEVTGGVTFRF